MYFLYTNYIIYNEIRYIAKIKENRNEQRAN